ncbi:MAG: ATP-dependent DNA/RNA helicase [Peltula sp. TS41687]|nr:MAG: ATP-dependent DNA/RNA helicase [Peltula sp. TS41687]
MKRKLDERDAPTSAPGKDSQVEGDNFAAWLDPRILQSLVKEKYIKPTPVQEKAIPLALEGKDIFARAKPGSGKTAAYLLPIIQSILNQKTPLSSGHPAAAQLIMRQGTKTTDAGNHTSALILVPTKELAEQVFKAVVSFTGYCAQEVRALNLALKVAEAVQRSLLADGPDIVIATPKSASDHVNRSALCLDRLAHLVIDEADLVLEYGIAEDLDNVAKAIPPGVQTFLMSATLTDKVTTLKGLFCRDPVVLDVQEKDEPGPGVTQNVIRCGEDEKFLLIYAMFKLKLVKELNKGKCIIFVGDIDRCYRLKLFMEQFGIKACVLNSELPVNSRIHVVEEFNKNVYDIIIATDEHEVLGTGRGRKSNGAAGATEKAKGENEEAGTADEASEPPPKKKKRQPQHKKDKEYGISRGIDFKNVACVLNFDLPTSSISYTHRIGRTARAGKPGMAMSFVVPKKLYGKHKPTSIATAQNDEAVLEEIMREQQEKGKEVKPYHVDMKKVGGFRYRMEDALRAVTRTAIRAARTREIRQELLKSEKLRRHFEENPADLHHLRHDGELRAARIQPHLKHVPEYLLPRDRQKGLAAGTGTGTGGFVGFNKTGENRIRRARMNRRGKGGSGASKRKSAGRKIDVLKSCKAGDGGGASRR